MNISRIEIEQFGVWQDLNLPLTGGGVSVFYGPNEAGKSTLMRFIRGVLYGFRESDERTAGPESHFRRCSGSLTIQSRTLDYVLRRESFTGTRGRLTINGSDHAGTSEERLSRLLGGASERLFENVFAIGLEELQQLATLSGEEVAGHIYGLSLGPQGRRILAAQSASEREVQSLLDLDRLDGKITDLTEQLAKVDHDLDSIHLATDRLSMLAEERRTLHEEIEKLQHRQSAIERNLQGYQFLQRVFPLWRKTRDLRRELDAIPEITGLAPDALDQLDELEMEIEEHIEKRTQLLGEIHTLEDQAEQTDLDPVLDENICAIRELLHRKEVIRRAERQIEDRRSQRDQHARQLQARLEEASADIDWDRLERFDSSAEALASLLGAGERYRKAALARARNLKRYRAAQKQAQQRAATLQEKSKVLGGESIAEARMRVRRQLAEVEELYSLQNQNRRLGETETVLREQLAAFPRRRDLPPQFNTVLWVFAIAGVVLLAFGLASLQNGTVAGGNTAWISGAIFILLAISTGGITWTLKDYFSQFLKWDPSRLTQRIDEIAREREQVQRRLNKLTAVEANQQAAALYKPQDPPEKVSEDDLTHRLHRRLGDLDLVEELQQRVASDRTRLSRYRETLQLRQRSVASSRREWTELLRRLNLKETLNVTEALHTWQEVAQIQRAWQEQQWEDREAIREEELVTEFREEVKRLSRIVVTDCRSNDPWDLLAAWDLKIRQVDAARRERKRLLQEARLKQRDLHRVDETIDSLRARRLSFLARAGAGDREELAARIATIQKRKNLARELETAVRELESARRNDHDLAVVEDDLHNFNPEKVSRQVEDGRRELKTIEKDLHSFHEQLGRIRTEIRQIEEDGSLEALSRKRKRLAIELREATERWAAARLAGQAIDRVRQRVERSCQPTTLKLASDYLERLTLGKYTNVWAPLGEKSLVIDDEDGKAFRVGHLSSGTREQLFLAVRMAMVREFGDRGIVLPMVLDDILVNFDQERTEAAVDALLEFADEGRQLLFFTCHLHLADLFEAAGASPVWLPVRESIERAG